MQAKLTAPVNTAMSTACLRSGCPSISRIWASRLVRFAGVAIALAALASCNSTTTKQTIVDYQQDAGARIMPHDNPLRFFVVEDQILVRGLICRDLMEAYPGCTITVAGSLAEIRAIEPNDGGFDVAIVDLELPDGSALDWVRQSVRARPDQRIVILSALDEDYTVYQAMHSDAPGYVHKNDTVEVLRQAIEVVLEGGVFFSPSVVKMCREKQSDPKFFNKILSIKEQEALKLFGAGLSDEEVAAILALAETSVAAYRKRIMAKLDLHSQRDLMKYAVAKGFSRLH